MGLLFNKKKKNADPEASGRSVRRPFGRKKKASAKATPASDTTPATVQPTPNELLYSLDIEPADDGDYEVMTPETKKAIEQERAAIRKQLFLDEERSARNSSLEITSDGTMVHTIQSDDRYEDDYDDDQYNHDLEDYVSQDTETPPPPVKRQPQQRQQPQDLDTRETDRLVSLADTPKMSSRKVFVDDASSAQPTAVNTSMESSPERPFDESATKKKRKETRSLQDNDDEEEDDDGIVDAETLQDDTVGEYTRDTRESAGTYDTNTLEESRGTTEGGTFVTGDSFYGTAKQKKHVKEVARKLFGAFQCADDKNVLDSEQVMRNLTTNTQQLVNIMDHFYDPAACVGMDPVDGATRPDAASKRPYYDEQFTRTFLKRMTTRGSPLLSLAPPRTSLNPSDDWNGRTVTMFLEKGTASDDKSTIQPTLEWTTIPGGQTFEVSTTSVSLYKILNITKSAETPMAALDDSDEENEKECFFTITTETGDMYFFEANSVVERDRLVNGLRNVLSRLAFHLIAGDATASSELYDDDGKQNDDDDSPSDLPHLPNPHQIMNRLSHILLD